MIAADQFSRLPAKLVVAFSSRDDGTMLDRTRGLHDDSVVKPRIRFCRQNDVEYGAVVYQKIMYSSEATYDTLVEVDERATLAHSDGVVADGLYTRKAGVGLFLPVADCIATVVYDAVTSQLAMLHLGRHSTLTALLSDTIRHFKKVGSAVDDIQVWMAPSVQRQSYRLEYFDEIDTPDWQPFIDRRQDGIYIDMQGYNQMICLKEGVASANIYVSAIDTATDDNYFSHSQGDTHGRIAVLAMIKP